MTLTKFDSLGLQGLFLKGNADHLKLAQSPCSTTLSRNRVVVEAKEYGKLPKTVGTFPATLKGQRPARRPGAGQTARCG